MIVDKYRIFLIFGSCMQNTHWLECIFHNNFFYILGRRIIYDYDHIGDSPGVDFKKNFFILIDAVAK